MSENSDKLIADAIYNINQDRKRTGRLLRNIEDRVLDSAHEHKDFGMIAAKYVETLQRSNEQLVKIITVLTKNKPVTQTELTQREKEDLYDEIEETPGDV
jgi:hypothetical protein